jgi:hypothetical protein
MKLITSLFKAKAATATQPPVQLEYGKSLTNSSTKVLSNDDVECSICFDCFDLSKFLKIPRILPCGHSFCSECLEHLVQVEKSFKCPKCSFKIQNVTHEAIPRNFHLMEKLEITRTQSEEENLLRQIYEIGDHGSCPLHAGEQLKVYDSTSRKAVCSMCALMPEHRGKSLSLPFPTLPQITFPFICCPLRP